MSKKELIWFIKKTLRDVVFNIKFFYKSLKNINKNPFFCEKKEALYIWDIRENAINF